MLGGKVPMPSLEVLQALTAPFTKENLVLMRAKLVVEAIVAFEANAMSSLAAQSSRINRWFLTWLIV